MNSPHRPTPQRPLPDAQRLHRRRVPLGLAAGRAILATVVALSLTSIILPPAQAQAPLLSTLALTRVSDLLTALKTRTDDSDPRYYKDKVWHDGTATCFRCTLGPAVLSAIDGSSQHDAAAIQTAVESFDLALKKHQHPDGAIVPAAPGEGGPDIQTVMFANELAETYLILGDDLDPAHRRQWSKALTRSADFLIKNGNLGYYTNGNVNLSNTMLMDLTYRITKLTRFKSAAKRSLAFTTNPPQKDKWAGFGLRYSTVPTKADGSDGAAYLTESGAEGPGYDPAYTIFQSNLAAAWYLLTANPDALRLTNLLYNQLVPRVRTSDWTIDVSGGTRRTAPGVRYPFYSAALPVLALRGGRSDLVDLVQSQNESALTEYRGATNYAHAGFSFNYGLELGMAVRVITTTPGW